MLALAAARVSVLPKLLAKVLELELALATARVIELWLVLGARQRRGPPGGMEAFQPAAGFFPFHRRSAWLPAMAGPAPNGAGRAIKTCTFFGAMLSLKGAPFARRAAPPRRRLCAEKAPPRPGGKAKPLLRQAGVRPRAQFRRAAKGKPSTTFPRRSGPRRDVRDFAELKFVCGAPPPKGAAKGTPEE
jgi:hypothetical protein